MSDFYSETLATSAKFSSLRHFVPSFWKVLVENNPFFLAIQKDVIIVISIIIKKKNNYPYFEEEEEEEDI